MDFRLKIYTFSLFVTFFANEAYSSDHESWKPAIEILSATETQNASANDHKNKARQVATGTNVSKYTENRTEKTNKITEIVIHSATQASKTIDHGNTTAKVDPTIQSLIDFIIESDVTYVHSNTSTETEDKTNYIIQSTTTAIDVTRNKGTTTSVKKASPVSTRVSTQNSSNFEDLTTAIYTMNISSATRLSSTVSFKTTFENRHTSLEISNITPSTTTVTNQSLTKLVILNTTEESTNRVPNMLSSTLSPVNKTNKNSKTTTQLITSTLLPTHKTLKSSTIFSPFNTTSASFNAKNKTFVGVSNPINTTGDFGTAITSVETSTISPTGTTTLPLTTALTRNNSQNTKEWCRDQGWCLPKIPIKKIEELSSIMVKRITIFLSVILASFFFVFFIVIFLCKFCR